MLNEKIDLRKQKTAPCGAVDSSVVQKEPGLSSVISLAELKICVKSALEVRGFASPEPWMTVQALHYATPMADLVYHGTNFLPSGIGRREGKLERICLK